MAFLDYEEEGAQDAGARIMETFSALKNVLTAKLKGDVS